MTTSRSSYARILANLVLLPVWYGFFWLVTWQDAVLWLIFRIVFWTFVAAWWLAVVLNLWLDYREEKRR